MPPADDLTALLRAWAQGDPTAANALMAAVYEDLRRVARRRLHAERADHSLVPTALVHEAYLRLVELRRIRWQNRAHFYAIAARVMRQILVDHARAHAAAKRGGNCWTIPMGEHVRAGASRELDLLDLDAALNRLNTIDPRLSHLVVLRFFAGLTFDEAAEILDVSLSTVKRDWARARAFLFRELRSAAGNPRASKR